ncbi:Glycosyltransferase involved in cell wall bisynthesis [Desulfotomaculum arcticum]|uniref:Glycosyltransferase involved in cell wall bisynthesis n=1 Tax=Desulfotruncus arcticus DSM 17038 TaxID=1121424 RepID=A0A1I2PKZ9_9FIRM|nr:glycosyltransferase family 1 protein [Desulfotruncus arcticus]SFG16230.1 Glycosyltransferase involved in cell wall bisynthesis [Desulfotomaculum arcticum] [Desulfotruncus arcticus DSM 17038]
MRVAIFTDTFVPQVNGVAQVVAKFVAYLKQNNIANVIFAPNYGRRSTYINNYNVFTVPCINFPLYPECKLAFPGLSAIRQQLEEFSPDIIHLMTPFSIGLCGLKMATKTGIPFVASFHTDFPGYLNYYRLSIFEGLAWQYLRWFHNRCGANFCPSEDTSKLLKINNINNVKIWGNGVDITLFNPARYSNIVRRKYVPEDKIAFLYVGRLAPEKNLTLLFNAFQRVYQKYPNAHLVITGDGPSYHELKQKAPQGVTFTGYLTGAFLAEIYASCDAFVFPSTTETYGLVILEAMASGLPVVAAYAGGIKENLIHNYNGLACVPQDEEDLSLKMELMLRDQKLRSRLAKNAVYYAAQKSWDHVFNELLENYYAINSVPGNKILSYQ